MPRAFLALSLAAALGAACRQAPAGARLAAARRVRIPTGSGLTIHPALSPSGDVIAYSSDRTGRFEIYVRTLDGAAAERALTTDGKQNFEAAWSPDGAWIAYHSKGRGGIWKVPARGGAPALVADFGSHPAWSPDGELIAFQSQTLFDFGATAAPAVPPSTIWVVGARGGPARDVTREGAPPGGHGAPEFSADSRQIFFVVSDQRVSFGELWTVGVEGGAIRRVLTARRLYDPVVQGEQVLFAGSAQRSAYAVYRTRTDGGPPELLSLERTAVPRDLSVSRDGTRAAWCAVRVASRIVSVPVGPDGTATGTPRELTHDSGRDTWPVFSPDGSRIAFGRTRTGINADVWVMDADGGNPRPLTSDPAADFLQDWFPSGDRIFILSDRSGRFTPFALTLADGKVTPLAVDTGDLWVPRLSPDGRRIAYNSKSGGITVNVWTAPLGGGRAEQLTFDRESMGFPTWSPDGRFLAMQVQRGDDTQVVVLPSTGGTPELLTSAHGQSWAFSWSPDGGRLAFAGLRDEHWNVYSLSRATRQERRLTDDTKLNVYVRYPSWSPRGDQVVYERAETSGEIILFDGRAERR